MLQRPEPGQKYGSYRYSVDRRRNRWEGEKIGPGEFSIPHGVVSRRGLFMPGEGKGPVDLFPEDSSPSPEIDRKFSARHPEGGSAVQEMLCPGVMYVFCEEGEDVGEVIGGLLNDPGLHGTQDIFLRCLSCLGRGLLDLRSQGRRKYAAGVLLFFPLHQNLLSRKQDIGQNRSHFRGPLPI